MMKRVASVSLALLAPALADAAAADSLARTNAPHMSCNGGPNEVLIVIKDVEKSVGLITVELYRNEPLNFLSKEGRELRMRVAAKSPVTTFCVHAPAAASYAMAAYHDRNANLKFDKNPLGLPAEPYGVSNNPRMRFAPPPIEEALFDVAGDGAKVEIKLNN